MGQLQAPRERRGEACLAPTPAQAHVTDPLLSLPLKTYRLIRKNIKEMMRMPPVKAENNRPTMESKE
jgi:hypothetical protein